MKQIIDCHQFPNSSNLYVLDLRYFTSIQSLNYHHAPKKNIEEVIKSLQKSFKFVSVDSLSHFFNIRNGYRKRDGMQRRRQDK